MSQPFLAEIKIISWNYAPKGWAFCNGQFLPINQNQALFSLLGTTYGGNGQTTFALPDFRGRVPVQQAGDPLADEVLTAVLTATALYGRPLRPQVAGQVLLDGGLQRGAAAAVGGAGAAQVAVELAALDQVGEDELLEHRRARVGGAAALKDEQRMLVD